MDKIGDQQTFKDGITRTYAGEKYGYVTPEKYQELFDTGRLARGQQFIDSAVESSVHTLKRGYKALPDNFHKSVSAVKNDWDNIPDEVKDAFNTAYKWTLMPTLRGAGSVLTVLDAPVNAAYWVSKKVDPTGRGISKDAIALSELVIPFFGPTKKGAKKIIKKSTQYLNDVKIPLDIHNKNLVLAGDIPVNGKVVNGANGANGLHTPLKITVHDSENLIGKGAIRNQENKGYFERIKKHQKLGSEKKIIDNVRSTPPKTIDDTPEIFKDQTFVIPDKTVKQHHLFPKAEDAAFLEVMEEIGDKEDVLNMLAIKSNMDAGGGGRMSGILNMFDKTHTHGGVPGQMLHPLRKQTPGLWGLSSMQPSPTELKTFLRQASEGNSTKLTQLYKQYIRENVIPFKNKAIKLQEPYNHELLLPKGLKKSRQLINADYVYDLVHDPRVKHWIDQFLDPRASK